MRSNCERVPLAKSHDVAVWRDRAPFGGADMRQKVFSSRPVPDVATRASAAAAAAAAAALGRSALGRINFSCQRREEPPLSCCCRSVKGKSPSCPSGSLLAESLRVRHCPKHRTPTQVATANANAPAKSAAQTPIDRIS
jgi:hypothetical protein